MAGQLVVDLDTLRAKHADIEQLDARLDTSAAAGKRKIVNEISAEYEGKFETSDFESFFTVGDERELVARLYFLSGWVKDNVQSRVDSYVETLVEQNKTQAQEKLTDSEREALVEQRKTLLKEYDALVQILGMVGVIAQDEDTGNVLDGNGNVVLSAPKRRVSSGGPRGPHALSTFQYTYDDVELPAENNKLSFVAKSEGIKTSELKTHIESQVSFELKKGKIPDNWEVTTPSGKTLTATRMDQFLNVEGYGPDEETDEDDEE